MHYKLEVKQEYVYGPYYIRNNGVGWYWGHATRDIQDERVFGNPGSAAHAIDEWEVKEKAEYATAQGRYATRNNASVPEQERYVARDPDVNYVTSPPPMEQYPKPYKAPNPEDSIGVEDYIRKVAKSIEDYINERWS